MRRSSGTPCLYLVFYLFFSGRQPDLAVPAMSAPKTFLKGSVAERNADELGLLDNLGIGIDSFEFACDLGKRNLCDLAVFQRDHVAVLLLENQLACCSADLGGEDAVISIGSTAALCVAGNRDTDFTSGRLLDLSSNLVGD